ncbi:MAG: DUF6639 family protein [Paracoccaceae bacterium]
MTDRLTLALGASLFGALAAPLQAEALLCRGGEVTVESPDHDGAALVCDLIEDVRPIMAACGLEQDAPLTIQLVTEITHATGAMVGSYTADSNAILLTHPDHLSEVIAADHPFSRLPPPVTFRSLLVHELSHAFLDQAECTRQRCVAEHEYVAYAMQLYVLTPEAREMLIGDYRTDKTFGVEILNDFIALSDPLFFASRVWEHFSQPENGCEFIRKIKSGKVDLRLPPL